MKSAKSLSKEAKKEYLFSKEPIHKAILKVSFAGFITMFIFSIYEITDTLIAVNLGSFNNFSGESIRIAIQSAAPIYMVSFAISTMIATGISTRLAILQGKKDVLAIKNLLGSGISTFIITMTIVCILLTIATPFIISHFATLAPEAERANISYQGNWYTWILLWGLFFEGLSMFGIFYLRSEGALVAGTIPAVISIILNIVGDLLFVWVFKMSLIGSAIATLISWFVQLAFIVIYLFVTDKHNLIFQSFHHLRMKKLVVIAFIAAGVAPLIRNLGYSINALIVNELIKHLPNSYNDNLLPTYATVSQIIFIFWIPSFGIVQGSQAFIGYNAGSKNHTRIKKSVLLLIAITFTYFAVIEMLIMIFNHQLLEFFAGTPATNDPGYHIYYAEGKHMIYSGFCMLFLLGPQLVTQLLYQSVGLKKIAILTTSLRYIIVFVPVALIMLMISIGINNNKIFWFYLPITDFISAIICLYFLNKLYHSFDDPKFLENINN